MTVAIALRHFLPLLLATAAAVHAYEADGPFNNIKTTPVTVAWKYSNDGGKTFSDTPLAGPPAGTSPSHGDPSRFRYSWKGTFEVADPAKVGGLWVRLVEKSDDEKAPRASICNGDLVVASGGYWKDLGYCPTLLDAAVTFNGKEVPIAQGAVLQFWVPLLGEIRKGQNTIELRGGVYTFWQSAPTPALDARVVAAAPQPAEINNGPILGDFGDGYFTVACRTQMPAEVKVTATPTEPAGAPVTVSSSGPIWHRLKVEIPKGTRRVSYAISTKVGTHETTRGPYAVTLPGKEFNFAAFGGMMQHRSGADLWKAQSQFILHKVQPDFVVNTGNLMEQETWSFQMEEAYTAPAAELFARVPTLITPCGRDFTGIFNELHYTPAADGYSHNWTKVIGSVRFIGIDGNVAWAAGNPQAKWLESVLGDAKEKFVVVLSGYPAYSSGINSKKMFGGREKVRDVVMPILAKFKATVVLSSWDPDYERIEPTPDKGVTQIVTGCIAQGAWHRWDTRLGSHPFGPGPDADARGTTGKVTRPDGGEWVGYSGRRHVCLFTVKEDSLEMKVRVINTPDGKGADSRDWKTSEIIDEKSFKPRH